MTTATTIAFDPKDLESKVKAMYRDVATNPKGEFHFEMGRALAERLGYKADDLDRIPAEAIESFAGVGYFFHLADLRPGEIVIDLGSGSGMDTFIAALKAGVTGKVIGVDMTDEQLAAALRAYKRAENTLATRRNELFEAIGEAVVERGIKQNDVVKQTGYTREHVRRICKAYVDKRDGKTDTLKIAR